MINNGIQVVEQEKCVIFDRTFYMCILYLIRV